MTKLMIRYVSPHGRQEECKFQQDAASIQLSMRAASEVDLTPLQNCHKLEKLDLSHNFLETLDLLPLSGKESFRILHLQDNRLSHLDLWPLHDCANLSEIEITENRLRTLDVTPIFTCDLLRTDSIVVLTADSILKHVLTPEKIMAQFQSVRTDRTAWTATPMVIWNDYDTLIEKHGWAMVFTRLNSVLSKIPEAEWFDAQKGLLEFLKMQELSGLDINPKEILADVSTEEDFESPRERIYDRVVELLENQVSKGGPTLFLEVSKMRDTRASRLIPSIVRQRKAELENLEVQILRGTAFLHSLWMTSYGFDVLSALDYGLTVNAASMKQVVDTFDDAGFELLIKRVDAIDHPSWTNTSPSFRRFVFRLARSHTGRRGK